MPPSIAARGVRVHNLKDIDVVSEGQERPKPPPEAPAKAKEKISSAFDEK